MLFSGCFWGCLQKSTSSSVCGPVRCLHSFYPSISPSICPSADLHLDTLDDRHDQVDSPSLCAPPPSIQSSNEMWLLRRYFQSVFDDSILNRVQLCLYLSVLLCPLPLSTDVLRTRRSRWSSWDELCRSWLWSPVCPSPSPELLNTRESPLHRPAEARLDIGQKRKKSLVLIHQFKKDIWYFSNYQQIPVETKACLCLLVKTSIQKQNISCTIPSCFESISCTSHYTAAVSIQSRT